MKHILVIVFLIIAQACFPQAGTRFRELSDFASRTKDFMEGFDSNMGQNTFTYHSFRSDLSESLISRCTSGDMEIAWQTASVPDPVRPGRAGFVWIAAMDHNNTPGTFCLKFNGKEIFTFRGGTVSGWKIDGAEGSSLEFFPVETDQHGDPHGYMALKVPASWLKGGKKQEISITGSASGANTWIIVYQAKDALSDLQNSIDFNTWMKITFRENKKGLKAGIELPESYAGKEIALESGKSIRKLILAAGPGSSHGEISLGRINAKQSFRVSDSKGILAYVPDLQNEGKNTCIQHEAIIETGTQRSASGLEMTSARLYKSALSRQLLELAGSPLNRGDIFLISSSHQDIAWMDSPESCVVQRDTMLLQPMVNFMQRDTSYRFDIEDALMVKEFVNRHPDQRPLIQTLLNSGQVACGATYTQPYEEMYSGEALARQFYFGKRWLKVEFGYNANTYWNQDVPGRTLQMPQLMKKAGVNYLMFSRHRNGLFNWQSPDGSSILAYSASHYGDAYAPLRKDFYAAADFISKYSLKFSGSFKTGSKAAIPLLSEADMSPATDFSNLFSNWKSISGKTDQAGRMTPLRLPGINYATSAEFFEAVEKPGNTFETISGERPAVWLYIHGPTHYEAISSSRRGDMLLTAAEKFATAYCLLEGSFAGYPVKEFEAAWEAKIYPDHGWGGKNGDITDNTFLRKYEFAETTAGRILESSLRQLSSAIKLSEANGIPVTVFNSTSWRRTDEASFSLHFGEGEAKSLTIKDMQGNSIPVQMAEVTTYPDQSLKSAEVHFIAEDVPSIGYKTYRVIYSTEKLSSAKPALTEEVENRFYRFKLGKGGLESIFDKESGRELVNPGKFLAGEVFTLHSFGNGAGEFSDIQPVDMEGYDRTGNYETAWENVAEGAVFSSYRMRQPVRHAVVETTVTLWHTIRKIDFDIALLNFDGEPYREFRMALPLDMPQAEITYEVPFGSVTVGKDEIAGAAGERYTTPCKDVHPRGIGNWISAHDRDFAVTMSSCVSVADYIDPTDNPADYPVLQPILLASRKSCHWEGNFYLQTGDHHYHFSLTSGKPDVVESTRFGTQSSEPLFVVAGVRPYADASLPTGMSFFECSSDSLVISAVKKAEDGPEVVARIYNLTGKEIPAGFRAFRPVINAGKVSLIEFDPVPVPVPGGEIIMPVGKYAVETVMFNTSR